MCWRNQNPTVLPWQDETSSLNLGCSRVRLCRGLILFPRFCPNGHLSDMVLTGDQSLGLIQLSWSPLTFRAVKVISRCWSTIWSGYGLNLSGSGALGTTMKETNISVDAIFLQYNKYIGCYGKRSRFQLAKLMQHYNPLTQWFSNFLHQVHSKKWTRKVVHLT